MKNSEFKIHNLKSNEEYFAPKFELIQICSEDIISTSPGTETTPRDDNDGIWDFDMG